MTSMQDSSSPYQSISPLITKSSDDLIEDEEDKELEEMSGAGAVGGYSGRIGKKVEEDEIVESIYNYLVSNMESII